MRRAATSIPLNIAEGSVKKSYREFLNFLSYSYGSAKEGKYTAFAEKIVDHLLGIQDADGAWLKNEPAHTSFDQTAEIAIWLREIISESQAI